MSARARRFVASVTALAAIAVWPTRSAAQVDPSASAAFAHQSFQLTPARASIARPIVVDRTPSFAVALTAVSPLLRVSLVAPDKARFVFGESIPGRFQSGVEALESTAGDAGAKYIAAMADPTPGVWSLEVSAASPLTRSIDVDVLTTFSNDVQLAFTQDDDVYAEGARVRVALALRDGARRVRALSIGATLSRSDDSTVDPVAITFRDDGEGADEAANDGVYEAFVVPDRPGIWQIRVDADGAGSTGIFHRSASGSVTVVPARASVTAFASHGRFVDQSGLLDQIVVSPMATIAEGGDYVIMVRLRGSNGHQIERSVSAALSAGPATVDVEFDATDIVSDLGVDGPYHVERIAFTQTSGDGDVPAAVRDDAGDTEVFQLALFQTPALRLTGEGSAVGAGLDADGLFARLDVRVDVVADVAGSYSYSASLTDATGSEIGLAAGSQALDAGASTIALTIPGQAIARYGADGPYCLSNFLVFGAGHSLLERQALVIGGFRAHQFAGSAPDAVAGSPSSVSPLSILPGACGTSDMSPALQSLTLGARRSLPNGRPGP